MSYQEVYNGLNKKASNEQIKKLASIIGMRKKAAPNWMAAAKGTLTSGSSPLVSSLGAMPGAYNSDPVPRGAGSAYLKMIANQNKQLSRGEAARAYTKDLAGRAANIQYPGTGLARRIYGKVTGSPTAGSAKGPGIPNLNKILGNSSAWLGSAVNQNKPQLESYSTKYK